jgi:7-cyano-7-deazaguanine synthase
LILISIANSESKIKNHKSKMSSTAVLLSAGLDSAVLAASEARRDHVQPIYVSAGLAWETGEREALTRLLESAPFAGHVGPVAHLTFTVRDLYPASHWALRGEPPGFDTPDEDVYLAGRNVILLSKASIFCAQHGIPRIAIGPLAGNPFPDATPTFFAEMGRALSTGLAHPLEISAPFLRMHKADVVKLGAELGVPMELTLSCMNPADGRHCGMCSKCRERRDAFREAGVEDRTEYATRPQR